MEANPKAVDETEETAGKLCGFENVKNVIADKLYHMARVIGEKADNPDGQPDVAACKKQASEWLDHWAQYVRQFDYKQADANARQYVSRNPGRCILIAGAVGLLIGAIVRRRQG